MIDLKTVKKEWGTLDEKYLLGFYDPYFIHRCFLIISGRNAQKNHHAFPQKSKKYYCSKRATQQASDSSQAIGHSR
jgi:hypothetical protein